MKWLKKLFTALYAGENILYFSKGSGDVVFNCNEMGILIIILMMDNNFDEDDSDTIILIRLLAWHIKFEKRRT